MTHAKFGRKTLVWSLNFTPLTLNVSLCVQIYMHDVLIFILDFFSDILICFRYLTCLLHIKHEQYKQLALNLKWEGGMSDSPVHVPLDRRDHLRYVTMLILLTELTKDFTIDRVCFLRYAGEYSLLVDTITVLRNVDDYATLVERFIFGMQVTMPPLLSVLFEVC